MTNASEHSTSSETDGPTPRRLTRSVDGKVIAGVARGLGDRFDVDANIFRVIFVVLAFFWGLGVAIYLVMWDLVPRASGDGTRPARDGRPPVSTSHRVSLTLAVGAVIALAMVAVVATGRSHPHVVPSLALVWLAFLVALAVVATRTAARRLTLRRLAAVAFLAGLSALILAVGAVTAFVASAGVPMAGGNGAHVWQPTGLRGVHHHYTTDLGAAIVDLSAVTFASTGYVITASTAVGTLRVVLPRDAVVSVTTHVGIGSVRYFRGSIEVGAFDSSPASASPTVRRRLPHVTLIAMVGIGSISVVRAAGPPSATPSAG